MKREESWKKEDEQSTILHQQTLVLEKGVEKLNKHTEMFLRQQNKGMNKFFELEAMKYASELDEKEYFEAISKRTILTEKNWLLASQIEHQQLLKKLNETKEDNATQE